jgi:hypothetical protein
MYFSRRNDTTPLPPLPAIASIRASSTNFIFRTPLDKAQQQRRRYKHVSAWGSFKRTRSRSLPKALALPRSS